METKDTAMELGGLAIRVGSADGIFGPRYEDVDENAGLEEIASAIDSVSSSLARLRGTAQSLGDATPGNSLSDVKGMCNALSTAMAELGGN